uniref:Ribonuclease H-like domain-containing protein n=1 Tax=Tanacetum cinerariifolium TaxID=118510 RepID=A0A6L2MAX4_TANCI|nr:ribonuclease H-like domain-containing protein [Tanacetum cinerariifolium]
MVTRFRVGTNHPTKHLNLHVSSVSPLPKYYPDAFNDQNWQNAMCDEYIALIKNKTWTLVPRPPDTNIVRCTWIFHHRHGTDTAYLLLYVDDIVITASSESLLQQIIRSLHQEFAKTDLGPLNYFLGILITHDSSRLILSQKKYALQILDMAHMDNCNLSRTPIDTESKLRSDGDPVSNPTLYRSLAGSLQYLTFTRLDIFYAVQQVCLYMHNPREPQFFALKQIMRYVHGTLDYGLQLFSSSTTDLVSYSDADWAGCPNNRCSTSCYCVFLGNNLLSWSSKRQPTLSHSSAEAKYHGVANAIAETYKRIEHIEIDIHSVRDLVIVGQVRILHVPSHYQFTKIFTKGLPSALFEEFCTTLSVWCPPALTAGSEKVKSIASKAKKKSSDDQTPPSDSEGKEHEMAVRDFKKYLKEMDQKALVGGSWSDSKEEEYEKTNEETCLMAHDVVSFYTLFQGHLTPEMMQICPKYMLNHFFLCFNHLEGIWRKYIHFGLNMGRNSTGLQLYPKMIKNWHRVRGDGVIRPCDGIRRDNIRDLDDSV